MYSIRKTKAGWIIENLKEKYFLRDDTHFFTPEHILNRFESKQFTIGNTFGDMISAFIY